MKRKELIVILSIVLIFAVGVCSGLKWVNDNPESWAKVDEIRY